MRSVGGPGHQVLVQARVLRIKDGRRLRGNHGNPACCWLFVITSRQIYLSLVELYIILFLCDIPINAGHARA